jgi:hypothetical protein
MYITWEMNHQFWNTEQNKFIKETRHNSITNLTYPKTSDFLLNSILQKLLLTPFYAVPMLINLAAMCAADA